MTCTFSLIRLTIPQSCDCGVNTPGASGVCKVRVHICTMLCNGEHVWLLCALQRPAENVEADDNLLDFTPLFNLDVLYKALLTLK